MIYFTVLIPVYFRDFVICRYRSVVTLFMGIFKTVIPDSCQFDVSRFVLMKSEIFNDIFMTGFLYSRR